MADGRRWMTLIADLHGRTPPVRPDSYVVLLAGDICPDGGIGRQLEFLNGPFRAWLAALPCPAVAVPGNHDYLLERPDLIPALPWVLLTKPRRVLVAGLSIWGCPGVLHCGMAFAAGEADFERALAPMPDRVDVLLCHNPPAGIGDRFPSAGHLGSVALRHACWKKRPRLCVFGHVHEARGHWRLGPTYFVNATLGAGCDASGRPVPAPQPPWGLADDSWRDPR